MVKTNTSSGIRAIGDSTQEQTTIDPALETYIRVVERMLGASQAQPKKDNITPPEWKALTKL